MPRLRTPHRLLLAGFTLGLGMGCRTWIEQSTLRHVEGAAEAVRMCEPFLGGDDQVERSRDERSQDEPSRDDHLITDHDFQRRLRAFFGDLESVDIQATTALRSSLLRLAEQAPTRALDELPSWVERKELTISKADRIALRKPETRAGIGDCPLEEISCFTKLSVTARASVAIPALLSEATILAHDFDVAREHAGTLASHLGAIVVKTSDSASKAEKKPARELSLKEARTEMQRVAKERRALASQTVTAIANAITTCYADTPCKTAITELPQLVKESAERVARIEVHAAVLREELRAQRGKDEISVEFERAFQESMGRMRRHMDWFKQAMPTLDGLARKSPQDFLRAYLDRGLGLTARLALDAMSSGVERVDESISELDAQLRGALSVARLIFGRQIDEWTEVAFLWFGEQASISLCNLSLSPEVVVAEACSDLVHAKSRAGSFVSLGPVYRGLVRGMGRMCPSQILPENPAGSSTPAVAEESSTSQASMVETELVSDWSSALACKPPVNPI